MLSTLLASSLYTHHRYLHAFDHAGSDELLAAYEAHSERLVHFSGTVRQSWIVDRTHWTFVEPYGSARDVRVTLSLRKGRMHVCNGDRIAVTASVRRVRDAIEAEAMSPGVVSLAPYRAFDFWCR
ncbi:MAG: hypothetical protein JO165_08220 [Candidatus Eremiobacteraeota bacterium]|nr:hypothetical protein [Candidatus Eremiobacteraeota bacterium]